MILHTLNKTGAHKEINEQLSATVASEDSIILIEDAVYQAPNCEFSSLGHWSNIVSTVYVLREDAVARGISLDLSDVSYVDYRDFVDLSVSHQKVISWY